MFNGGGLLVNLGDAMRYLGLTLFAALAASNAWELATGTPTHRWDTILDIAGLVTGVAGALLVLFKPTGFEPRSSGDPHTLGLREIADTSGPGRDVSKSIR